MFSSFSLKEMTHC